RSWTPQTGGRCSPTSPRDWRPQTRAATASQVHWWWASASTAAGRGRSSSATPRPRGSPSSSVGRRGTSGRSTTTKGFSWRCSSGPGTGRIGKLGRMTTSSIDAPDSPGTTDADPVRDAVHEAARRARTASRELSLLTADRKNALLLAAADALVAGQHGTLEANAHDIEEPAAGGIGEMMLDRLRLIPDRVEGIAGGLRQVADLADAVGSVIRGSTRPNGMRLEQVRVPLGVIGMIYEGRPNVPVDAFGLAFESGTAALLRGSRSARHPT